jgi:DNA invertase Pin-like site-specific DNA recombinase
MTTLLTTNPSSKIPTQTTIHIAGVIRKSPTKATKEKVSVEFQRQEIRNKVAVDFQGKEYILKFYTDVAKGDSDLQDRRKLKLFFSRIEDYQYAYFYNPDRYARSWLGIKWLHEYFTGNCKLRFVTGISDLYEQDGTLDADKYLQLFILLGFAQYELLRIRSRIKAGINRVMSNPKLKAEKYKGGTKGRAWANA